MPFPKTVEGLAKAGYHYENDSQCKACGAQIEWWTTPRNKKIPMDLDTAIPHWKTCPQADLFGWRLPDADAMG